jgi:aspartyl-tRNA(Asn)/glutamyl-tRNA(Gln) amidotransferase subunit B
MIRLIADGTISSKIAKKVFRELITKGGDAKNSRRRKRLGTAYLIQSKLIANHQ